MRRELAVVVLFVLVSATLFSQSQANSAEASLPRFVRYSGVLRDASGQPRSGAVGVTFALYGGESGGSPLWQETQTVTCDASGRYTALVGSQSIEGLPLLLFASNEARWLGVRGDDGAEQSQVLLVSVPYALKAGDAETLGGMTASQIMAMAQPLLASSSVSADAPITPGRSGRTTRPAVSSPAAPGPRGSFFMNGSQQAVVEAYDDGAHSPLQLLLNPQGGNVGVGTTTPGQKLSVAGTIESTTGGFKFPDATVQTTAGISQSVSDTRYLQLTGGTLTGTITASAFVGNASGLSNLSAGALTGTVAPINLPGSTVGPSLQKIATLNWVPPALSPRTFTVGTNPEALAFDGQNIWVTNRGDNNVKKLRASDGVLQGSYSVGSQPYGIAFDGTNMWIANFGDGTVTKLRASDGAPQGTFTVGTNPIRICFDGTNLWVTNYGSNNVTKLSPSGATVGTYNTQVQPYGIAFDGTRIWIANNGFGSSSVTVLKATDGSLINNYPVGLDPEDIAFDGVSMWVTAYSESSITRLNLGGAVLGTYPVGVGTSGIAFDGATIWVVNYSGAGTGTRIRTSDGTALGTFTTGLNPNYVVFDGSNIWTANYGSNDVTKIPVGLFPAALDNQYVRTAPNGSEAVTSAVTQKISGGLSVSNTASNGWGLYAGGDSIGVGGQGNYSGVRGDTFNPDGFGVQAVNNADTGGTGIYGLASGAGGVGVHGSTDGVSSEGIGVSGDASNGGTGVFGFGATGVSGESNTFLNTAVALAGRIHAGTGTVLKLISDATTADLITGISGTNTPQTVFRVSGTGDLTATSLTGSGSGLTNVNAATLGGVAVGNVARLNSANAFTAAQTINGNLVVSGTANITGGTAGNLVQIANTSGGTGLEVDSTQSSTNAALIGNGYYWGVRGAGGNAGVYGSTTSGYGVWGTGSSSFAAGVHGDTNNGVGIGVEGISTSNYGVHGTSSTSIGVFGESGNVGVLGHNTTASGGNYAYISSNCCAADLYGTVAVHGTLSKSAGSFKIDHPLDPANKYLSHSFVESPDMKNIYDGIVITDDSGVANVSLPDWFMALNKDFRYQLTVIGVFAQVIIDQEIADGHFRIRTNQPNVKVSWQVTGIRHDAYADEHRIVVEEDKPAKEKGTYMFPELFGQPAGKSQRLALHPESAQQ